MFPHLFARLYKNVRRRTFRRAGELHRRCLFVESLESRCVLNTAYLATDLVSDQPGVAPITDPRLINAWGIGLSPTGGAFWVSSEGAGKSTLYTGDAGAGPLTKNPLEVSIPGGEPTGQVFNSTTTDFFVSSGSSSARAVFIFASTSGAVSGWNPALPPSPTNAHVGFQATDDAAYTGIALASNGSGNFLYLADFTHREIDVLDKNFQLTNLAGSFTDPALPVDYSPFNVAALGGKIYVSYAKQDADDPEEEITGAHLGYVNVFDTNGIFLQRLVSQGKLDAPWGMVLAPATDFGDFSGSLLIGNFGDGRINAFDPTTGAYQGTLSQSSGRPIEIEGLWGLTFGNGATAGSRTSLYYAAGPDDETHGLFGKITANAAGTNPVHAELTGGDLVVTGSRNDDHIEVKLQKHDQQIVVKANDQPIGTFDLSDVDTIQINGLAGNDQIIVDKKVRVTSILDGGAGNDLLMGGRGNSILLGGIGNDHLKGSSGRDILIGGEGQDHLQGRGDDDLLIGGKTSHDSQTSDLLQILAEWTSSDSYNTRVDKLRNGTGGLPKLDDSTVSDDGVRDRLQGNGGLDWYFASLDDHISGKKRNEQVN